MKLLSRVNQNLYFTIDMPYIFLDENLSTDALFYGRFAGILKTNDYLLLPYRYAVLNPEV
ncbi:hypothetical protein [Mucilaginibacter sp. 22184]|uniref:hypothetical protein n=1 Tax=Mucilaginibacter sp. 22184 TaxID=3453887 RepID=UPI003F83741C|nr:hypothetical protein [Mucilaginibacter sp. SG564]